MYKFFTSRTVGIVIFLLIIMLTIVILSYSTKKMTYTWRWQIIPSYIIHIEKEQYRAATNGILIKEADKIYIKKDNGELEFIAKDANPLVDINSEVFYGELIAQKKQIHPGLLLKGLYKTLQISVLSIIFAIMIGIIAGMMRISPFYFLKLCSITYVEVIRGTPLLVQLFIVYYFFGNLLGFSQMVAGVITLSVFTGAYTAEIVRAGIQSVPRGQMEAARSLGMNYLQSMLFIILPQALKRSLPPMAGQFISLIKDSSLVSIIAITELTKAGREAVASSLASFEIWFTVALLYLVLTALMSYIINRFELHLTRAD